jgi:hypothetical protein
MLPGAARSRACAWKYAAPAGTSAWRSFVEFSFVFGIRPGSGDQKDPPRTGANAMPVVLATIL